MGINEGFYEGVAEKKEIIQTMRLSIQDKWQRLMDNSRLKDKVQEIIPKAGSAFKVKSEERRITRVINQLITGHTNLNYMMAKIDSVKAPNIAHLSLLTSVGYSPYLHLLLVPALQVVSNGKTGNQYPPNTWKWGVLVTCIYITDHRYTGNQQLM